MLRVVPKEEQRRYVKETLKAIEDLSWLDTKLTEGQLANLSQSVQTDCLGTLVKRLETLPRYQNGLAGAYTPGEMAADMADYIFRDVKAGRKLSDYNRLLQQAFTGVVIGRLESPRRAQGRQGPGHGVCGDGRRGHAARIPLRSHGDAGTDQRIRQIPDDILRQGFLGTHLLRHAAAAPRHLPTGRHSGVGRFVARLRRYMLRRIENSLKTD